MKGRIIAAAAVLAAVLGAGKASALNVPYTEDFTANVSGWEDNGSNPLTFVASGGPDGGSYASGTFNYFNYSNPFSGPAVLRASFADGASGGNFFGNWTNGGVYSVSAWMYQETGTSLNYFVRIANNANFPGVAFLGSTPVASHTWTQVTFNVSPSTPPCIIETVACSVVMNTPVGNIQFGTDAPASLVATNQAFVMAVDAITVIPEPGQALLFGSGLIGLGVIGRRRRNA